MAKTPKFFELLAVFPDISNKAAAIQTETTVTFSKKPDHFRGQSRSVNYFSETRASENTSETKEMVTTVRDKLDYTMDSVGRMFDALLQMEEANQRSKADLVVNGETIMESLPGTFLLGMEGRLKKLREMVAEAPTLDPALSWDRNESLGKDIFESKPQEAMRHEKTLQHKVLVAPTDKHPAQIEKWTEDVAVAKITTVHKSGMLTPLAKSIILGRIDDLISATKKARQRANEVELADIRVAKKLNDYIFAGL